MCPLTCGYVTGYVLQKARIRSNSHVRAGTLLEVEASTGPLRNGISWTSVLMAKKHNLNLILHSASKFDYCRCLQPTAGPLTRLIRQRAPERLASVV
jgi:hypothetical protein